MYYFGVYTHAAIGPTGILPSAALDSEETVDE